MSWAGDLGAGIAGIINSGILPNRGTANNLVDLP